MSMTGSFGSATDDFRTTVCGSGAAAGLSATVCGSVCPSPRRARLIVYATSSEVSGRPSDHLRFGRSLYVHVRLSGDAVHDAARPGIGAKSFDALSVSVAYCRFQNSYAATVTPTVGFALSRSCWSPTVSVSGLPLSWPDAAVTAIAAMAAAPASAPARILPLPLPPSPPPPLNARDYLHAPGRVLVQFVQRGRGRVLHEVPVEEPLEAAHEMQLGPGAQEAVRLGRVGDVLERLAEAAQLGDVLLGLVRVDAVVALAVGDEDRDLQVLQAVDRRAGTVRGARRRRRAHHALEVLHAEPVALRPGRDDVDVAVGRHRAAIAVLGVVGDRERRHVRAVAAAEDREAVAVDPVERRQEVGGGDAVLRGVHPPPAVFFSLEVAAVAGRAAEVRREPRVALVDEVLRARVVVVDVGVGRAAVRRDDRGDRRFR